VSQPQRPEFDFQGSPNKGRPLSVEAVEDKRLLQDYHKRMMGLGAFWLAFSVIAMILGTVLLLNDGRGLNVQVLAEMQARFISIGLCMVLAGVSILVRLKFLWAVYAGLLVSVTGLLVNWRMMQINIVTWIGILTFGLFLAFRVFQSVQELKNRDVSLNTKQEDL
jgi:hypothetical protein